MIVVDASVVVTVLLRLTNADALSDRLFDGLQKLYAPELLDVEVAQVIRRFWRAREISAARGSEAIEDLADLPIERIGHTPLVGRIWQLRNNVTAYDAAYLAVAESLNATLVTHDKALLHVPGSWALVEVV